MKPPTYYSFLGEGQQLTLGFTWPPVPIVLVSEPTPEPTPEPISALQRRVVMAAIAQIAAVKWPYLIQNDKGEMLGTLDYVPRLAPAPAPVFTGTAAAPPKKPRKAKVDRGETRAYWMPIVRGANLEIMQRVEVPFDDRWCSRLMAGHISSWASNEKSRFGRKYSTSRVDAKRVVEIVRVA